ncbi:MAG: TIM-barrel domain-containing protein [Paenibacillaceae bacterium]
MQSNFKEILNEEETTLLLTQKSFRREGAFLSYFFIKFDEPRKSLPFTKYSFNTTNDFHELVYWLWIVGEYTNQTEDLSLLTEYKDQIVNAIEETRSLWNKPQKHWLNDFEMGIYTSNISIAYGALLAINHHYSHEGVQKLLNEIRKFLFAKLIKSEKIVSELGDNQIHGDIILSAVPYGMLGIEDRILIEALHITEKELVTKGVRLSNSDMYYGGCERADLTCILAWYYSEKGDLSRAKQLLEQVKLQAERDPSGKLYAVDDKTAKEALYHQYWMEQNNKEVIESKLSHILYAIAERNVSKKLQNNSQKNGSAIKFIHQPTGSDDPYFKANFERIPRYPQSNENVVLNLVTEPLNPQQNIKVEWSVGGQLQTSERMKLVQAPDGEKLWKAELGSFQLGDEVEYRFQLDQAGGVSCSDTYVFKVRQWLPLIHTSELIADNERIQLPFKPLVPNGPIPLLVISKNETEELKLSFRLNSSLAAPSLVGISGNNAKLQFEAHSVKVKLDENGYHFLGCNEQSTIWETYTKHGESFAEVLTDGSGTVFKIRIKFAQKNGEKWFGMGERYSHMQFRGLNIDNYVYNEYRDQQLKTYIPSPFAISSEGYGIYLDTLSYSMFKFGTSLNDMLEIEADVSGDNEGIDLFLFSGKPLDVIRQYTDITGKPMLPPKWSFGPWMSSNNWDSQAETVKQVKLTNKYQIPATVIVLEQWSDEATFYVFNDAQYKAKEGLDHLSYADFDFPAWGRWPDPQKMVQYLHESGLKVLLWQIPIQKHLYGALHAQKDEDEKAMLASGYHVKLSNGEPYRIPYNWFKDCLIIDFTNPAAKEWWFSKREYLLDEVGIDGFKTDGGECVFGKDVLFFDGTPADKMRNRYPNDYIGSYYDFVQQHVKGNGITFSRAGYVGSQKYPLHWAGDERSTFAAFRASIIAGLSCSASGIPFWGWDLAGFHGDIPTAELFIRSTQMATFCPVMQYHAESKGEFNQDRTPWNIAERTESPLVLEQYKRFADLRMNLLPYIYDQATACSKFGIPLMRAMFIDYPDDLSCSELKEQYLFGDSLLVAPVTYEGDTTKKVYFPQGKWLSLFGNEEVTGSIMKTWKAPLDEIPVFIKQNSVIPVNLSKTYQLGSHIGNRVDQYEQLCLVIYMTNQIDYTFRDDLGTMIHVSAIQQSGLIHAVVTMSYDKPITLIFRKAGQVTCVEGNSGSFDTVNHLELLSELTVCQNDEDIFIQLSAQQNIIKVHLN